MRGYTGLAGFLLGIYRCVKPKTVGKTDEWVISKALCLLMC